MKNKKKEQIAAKEKHRKSLKRKNRSEPILERSEPVKIERPTILIICEGKNTEPSYFRKFRLTSATVKAVGEGFNTVSLVERAKQLSEEKIYDQVWCAFDADPKPDNPNQAENFNQAILLAEKYGFGVAYSNQAFEYWIILHLNDHQGGGIDRKDYNEVINKLLKPYGLAYDGSGNKLITEELFELLDGYDKKTGKERKIIAIERAKKILDKHENSNPAKAESSTTVFRLVEEIIKYI